MSITISFFFFSFKVQSIGHFKWLRFKLIRTHTYFNAINSWIWRLGIFNTIFDTIESSFWRLDPSNVIKFFIVCGQRPKDLVITWVVLVLGVNLLLGCTSGLNLAADLEPVLALFLNGPLPGSFSLFSSFHLQLTVGR